MVELKDGRLFLVWIDHTGGKTIGHDHAPCDVSSMVSDDGGMTWKDRKTLVKNNPEDVNIHFPNLLRLKNGEILFYYQRRHKLAPGTPQHSTSYVCRSRDECQTFTKPKEHDVIRQNNISGDEPVQLSTGRILLPIMRLIGNWTGLTPEGKPADNCVASVSYSDDDGESWKEAQNWVNLPLRGAMEPRIAELRDGRLLMTMRTQLGAAFQSHSSDQGLTWSDPQTTGLRAPESMPCLKRIPTTGDLMIVWNHSLYDPKFDHYGKRTPLTVAVSKDDGKTWEKLKDIETDQEFEFTNPAVHFTSKNKVIITYVASRMQNPVRPGRFGRAIMPLKAVIADIDWVYQ
jgi:sialidase-1